MRPKRLEGDINELHEAVGEAWDKIEAEDRAAYEAERIVLRDAYSRLIAPSQ